MKLQEIENQLLQEQMVIVPILTNSFDYQSRKFQVKNGKDGWYEVIFDNDGVHIIRKLSALQVIMGTQQYKSIIGYKILDGLVFGSFAQEKVLMGNMAQQHQVYFCDDRTDWDMIKVIRWEDNQLYYCQDYQLKSGLAYINVFRRFQEKKNLDGLKNVTPEIRLVYILARLEQERIEIQLKAEADAKAKEEFLKTLKGRLITTLHDAGAEYISHRQQNENSVVVIWKVAGNQFNSVIRTADFRMKEAGFCMSGHDKEHTLQSAVNLVKGYIDEDQYFDITRR